MDRKMAYALAVAAALLLAGVAHVAATAARGYEAAGGELVLLTLPLWVWLGEMIATER